ncbi:MAG: hypothetical protein NT099_10035 [Candidatus Saganbacteria bacterium]|nr:hypothetical protein [Candidatus Saganbacteria bacterium]
MFNYLNERIKKLSVVDMGLIKLAAMTFGILLVKILPQLISVRYRFLILLMVLFALKPVYVVWFKK